jgi:4-hydroxybenzoate polyprenyltransferase
MSAHTDIVQTGWIAFLPPAARPYALLARLDRPIGIWLLLLPGLWGILLARPGWGAMLRLAVLFGIGSIIMRAAGCVVNDLWDRDIDRQVSRTAGRPLASGAVTPVQALGFLAVLLLLGLAILLRLNRLAQGMGVLALIPVTLYPLAKRVTWWPQLVMGFTFGAGAPIGYAAARGGITPALFLLYGAVVLWQLGFDTIYAHQDREDDARIGIRSTARLLAARTAPFLALCFALMLAALVAAGFAGGVTLWFYPALLPAAVLLFRQVMVLDIDDPALCLRLFRGHRDIGLLIAAAFLIGS